MPPPLALAAAVAGLTASCTIDWITEKAPDVLYSAVTTGNRHACGLTVEGEVYCWRSDLPRPERIPVGPRFTSVSTFTDHTCGLDESGAAYCWGLNTFGQLGTSETPHECQFPGSTTRIPCARTPVAVETDLVFVSIDVGAQHTCALTKTGDAYCWGLNFSGQLGSTAALTCDHRSAPEEIPCSPRPVLAEGQLFVSLTAGGEHTCGTAPDNIGYCWGEGGSGRLGTGSTDDAPTPSRIAGDLTFQQISAGGPHTCGIDTEGTAYCWGSNADLQIGNKNTEPACGVQLTRCFTTPQRVADGRVYAAIAASDSPLSSVSLVGGHSCGLTVDRRVFCWGLNESGQLGGGPQLRSAVPVELDLEDAVSSISAGRYNTCGVTESRSVICWGFGSPLKTWKVPVS